MPGPGHIQLAVVDQCTNHFNKLAEYIDSGSETAIDLVEDLITKDQSKEIKFYFDVRNILVFTSIVLFVISG